MNGKDGSSCEGLGRSIKRSGAGSVDLAGLSNQDGILWYDCLFWAEWGLISQPLEFRSDCCSKLAADSGSFDALISASCNAATLRSDCEGDFTFRTDLLGNAFPEQNQSCDSTLLYLATSPLLPNSSFYIIDSSLPSVHRQQRLFHHQLFYTTTTSLSLSTTAMARTKQTARMSYPLHTLPPHRRIFSRSQS